MTNCPPVLSIPPCMVAEQYSAEQIGSKWCLHEQINKGKKDHHVYHLHPEFETYLVLCICIKLFYCTGLGMPYIII